MNRSPISTPSPAQGSRGRSLSRNLVIRAAVDILDNEGRSAVSLSALSRHIGVSGPSLYHHVRGIEDLLGQLQISAIVELGELLKDAAVGRSGKDALRAMANTHRSYAATYPHRYDCLAAKPPDRAALIDACAGIITALTRVLIGCGVPEHRTIDAAIAVFAGLHGLATSSASGLFGSDVNLDAIYENVLAGTIHSVFDLAESSV